MYRRAFPPPRRAARSGARRKACAPVRGLGRGDRERPPPRSLPRYTRRCPSDVAPQGARPPRCARAGGRSAPWCRAGRRPRLLADARRVSVTLGFHPGRRGGSPRVPRFVDRADPLLDQRPPLLVLEREPRRPLDEPAATAPADARVEAPDELVVEMHVNAHARSIAHF